MQAYLIKNITRLRKDFIVDGEFLMTLKIGTKLKVENYEFLLKGVALGTRSPIVVKNSSILIEPKDKIEDYSCLLGKTLEIIQ